VHGPAFVVGIKKVNSMNWSDSSKGAMTVF
jgi:hypothetical protein